MLQLIDKAMKNSPNISAPTIHENWMDVAHDGSFDLVETDWLSR